MEEYIVQWEINISADTPEEASRMALEIMRDKDSEALFFKVINSGGRLVDVDLGE